MKPVVESIHHFIWCISCSEGSVKVNTLSPLL